MPKIECECGQPMWANSEDADGTCPDCVSGARHGKEYKRLQAQSALATESRRRVIDNTITEDK